MEPPPLSAAMMPPNIIQQIHPDSIESTSSPQPPLPLPLRPRIGETTNDESLLPNTKLRLMCSYGGHIMPRPHDKSLSYVGGDTRIVVVDRQSSLRDLCFRLSRTILNGRPFTLKYQLPNEDLDNLITVTTDEDLDNMIEEYDRLAASAASNIKSSSSSRLRVFLFFTKPESTLSMGCLLDDAKSETWFVDALNNSGILSRGVSDSAAGDCFVNLDSVPASNSSSNLEGQGVVAESLNLLDDNNNNNNNKVKNVSDVVVNSISTPGSPMLENSSSMANLAPIRVRVDENNGGSRLQQENRIGVVEEQFAQMTFSGMKPDDGFVVVSSAMPVIPAAVTMASAGVVTSNSSDNVNRIVSDEERLDYGAVVGSRKPPLPLQYVQQRSSGALSLPSPDSVTSESSIASTNSFSKIVYHQEQVQVQPTHLDNKTLPMPNSDNITGLQREQAHDPTYMLQPQMDQNQQLQQPQQQQQQFVHSSTHYIHHPTTATGQMPVSSYYQVYAAQPSQQQLHHPITQQQYPVYVMPVGPTPQYNMALQHSLSDPTLVSSGIPLMQQQTSSATPPIYPTKSATPINPEVTNSVYNANVASNSGFVQIPSNQFQQQYVGMPQYHHHHPPQQISVAPPSGGTNYGYEYGGHVQEQAYYTQQQQQPQQTNATMVTQYQSMTPAAAAAALSDASKQFSAADNVQQPNRTSQPV